MFTKEFIKEKLSSRKLWAAVAAFLCSVFTAFFSSEISPEEGELLQRGVAILCVYIFGETGIDIARIIKGERKESISDSASNEADEPISDEDISMGSSTAEDKKYNGEETSL